MENNTQGEINKQPPSSADTDAENTMKLLAEERLKTQALQQKLDALTRGEASGEEKQPDGQQPEITEGFERIEGNLTGNQQQDAPENNAVVDSIKADLEALKRKDTVHTYAEENNLTSDHKKIIMEAVVDKGMSLEDAGVYAQGVLVATGGGEALGQPTPPQSQAQLTAQEQAQEQANAAQQKPQNKSASELEQSAEQELEQAMREGTPISA